VDATYGGALRAAIEVARKAGSLLRQDFLKPGGPSGHDGHAEADEPAERLIRQRLLAATPEWGYLGEETGRVAGTDAQHLWLVDPNDGTRSYLKGYRGSAVSIALLRDGLPVLGVVYAFAAPDNQGDLFSWAEGCGPLERNGVPLVRAPWATASAPHTIILLNQAADRVVDANLACVAPGRYRAVPSIAYRLALVAAGEGEVGVSLNGPGAWDYAAGHALLRATGGTLVDQHGTPVTYTPEGASTTRWCFGGAPDLVGEVVRRGTSVFARNTAMTTEPYTLCWPSPGQTIGDDGLLERAQGCLLGQLAGDALGSMVEFQSASAIKARYPQGLREIGPSPIFHTLAGQPTDDSELALVLARTLLRDQAFADDNVAAAYAYWRQSGPFDVGGTIGKATEAILQAQARGQDPAQAARREANSASEANGALMRQSPLAIWGHALDTAALDACVRADTTLTHPNQVCQDASAALIVALAAVIREGLDAEAAYARACAWDQEHGASPTVRQALAAACHEPPAYEPNQGHVLIALQNAFYQALHAATLEDGVVATVMGGGDTDTNAAIAGALLGALHGARAAPAQWQQMVLTCRPRQDAPGVRQPRPPVFWPIDALQVAEQLLVAGARHAQAHTRGARSGGALRSRNTASMADRATPIAASGHPAQPAGPTARRAHGPVPPAETRFIGALLGGAMGDALGRPAEGRSPDTIRAHDGPLADDRQRYGRRSGLMSTTADDTHVTICVAECLVANGFLDPEDLARRFVARLPDGRGNGRVTTVAGEGLRDGAPWYRVATSSGNGTARRAAPIGLARWNDPARQRAEAILSTLPTPCEPIGVAGAVAMAAATAFVVARQPDAWTVEELITAIQRAITGLEPGPLSERCGPPIHSALHDRIGAIPSLLCRSPAEVFARLSNGAHVPESVPAALYCFLRSPDDVEEMLLLAVNAGYNTGSVAAMAGTLAGAVGGMEALPARLLHQLEYRERLTELAGALYRLAMGSDS
jgi:ADP-ribosyl-[dinitrogen reductase] hydrolase